MKFTPEQLECMSKEVDQLLATNIIQKCFDDGKPLSPIFCVGKNRAKMNIAQKLEGDELAKFETFRMVMDCRRINSITIGQKFVELPRSESIIASVANKLVSVIDVKAAYFSLVLNEETADRFRFRFNGITYRFNRVVMGGVMSMQQLMEALSETLSQAEFESYRQLKNIKEDIKLLETIFTYCDDLIVVTEDESTHLLMIEFIFAQFQKFGFKIQESKMKILCPKFKILGVTYTKIKGKSYTYSLKEDRVMELSQLNFPSSPRALASRLSVFAFYNHVLPLAKTITAPLYVLLRRKKEEGPGTVLPLHLRAWQMLMLLVSLHVQLTVPDRDKALVLFCDASIVSSGSFLVQLYPNPETKEDDLRVVGIQSRIFSPEVTKKSAILKEFHALLTSVRAFEYYIRANRVGCLILSDCLPLVAGLRNQNSSITFAEGNLFLSSFPNIKFLHTSGLLLRNTDILSRLFTHGYVSKVKMNTKDREEIPNTLFFQGQILSYSEITEITSQNSPKSFISLSKIKTPKLSSTMLQQYLGETFSDLELLRGIKSGYQAINPHHSLWAPFCGNEKKGKITKTEFNQLFQKKHWEEAENLLKGVQEKKQTVLLGKLSG